MGHDDTTYLDERSNYLDLGEDGESETVVPVLADDRGDWGNLGEEAWGGWDAE
ncbi:hypothetical protein KRR26_08520 [Corallococcus sp. M34]|uniref:hypothetical protein n=1 Tax=Citreicoccus inhibens TaxID=2849499 RepID=UPI0013155441|nr:hypothetical protein [Citreicoccus inhibens]MBU8895646.1 hypothetical protein [Citreicoccus inhibens]